ncbi:MAG: LysR family transcriptional regulator [Alphaproteobacteria bacterium]
MELRQLRYFKAIAEYGSFSEASLRLRVAQSALSRHTASLEQELGVALFERLPRGVTLTDSGTLLLDRAKDILERVQITRGEVMAKAALPSGEVVIGTTSTTSRILYGPLAERFAKDYPNVRLKFVEGVPYVLLEGLDTDRIDLAVMVDPEASSTLEFAPLVTEQEYLVGPFPSDFSANQPIDITSLASYPLILLPRPAGSRVKLDRLAREANIQLDVKHEVANIDVVKDFITRGLGLGILPQSSVSEEVSKKRFSVSPVQGLSITRTLVRRADRTPTPAVTVLSNVIREEIDLIFKENKFS